MKIVGTTADMLNKQAQLWVNYTQGDLETLEDLNLEEDYTLMPTKEVAALVEAVDNMLDEDVECNCDGCEEEYPDPLFGGAFYNEYGEFVYIERVIYDAPKTIVLWNDGTKTSSTCGEKDVYNPEMGLALAVLKKIATSDFVVKTLHDWAPVDNKTTHVTKTLKDVRRDHKVLGDK